MDAADDLVHDVGDVDVVGTQVGPHRLVAAVDVEADADRRDVLAVSDHAADRHRIADVAVGAEGGL